MIEGHVPADLIKKLLKEQPKIVGLSAPGMPAGSPGMDVPNSPLLHHRRLPRRRHHLRVRPPLTGGAESRGRPPSRSAAMRTGWTPDDRYAFVVATLGVAGAATQDPIERIREAEIKQDLFTLAGDAMRGREGGTLDEMTASAGSPSGRARPGCCRPATTAPTSSSFRSSGCACRRAARSRSAARRCGWAATSSPTRRCWRPSTRRSWSSPPNRSRRAPRRPRGRRPLRHLPRRRPLRHGPS